MADKKQLEILKQGADVWNKWRKDNLETYNDLPFAKVTIDTFTIIGLKRPILTSANLAQANLVRVDLNMADLSGSDLTGADLTQAKLTDAVLIGADFTGADLSRTDSTKSRMGGTVFGNNDLSGSIGLETIKHSHSSIIGINTLRKSKGKIPIQFLRGCGLSDLEIEFARLANSDLSEKEVTDILYKIHELRTAGVSIRYYSAFISYSSKDQEFAIRLHDDLQNNGVRCWFAPHDIQGGKKIHEQIDAAIRAHDRLLLILSEHSMKSEWVKTEIANARQKELTENRQVLFPISIVDYQKITDWKNFDADTGKDSAREIREYFIPDFSNWQDPAAYQSSFGGLLRDLKE